VRLARETPSARILLASFSQPLADALTAKVSVLAPDTGTIVPRITTASFQGIADQLHQLEFGVRPRIASETLLRDRIMAAATAADVKGFSDRFLLSEWVNVVDAWSIETLDDYVTVQRMGRKSRLGPKQRERLWPVFAAVRAALQAERYTTWAAVFSLLAARFVGKSTKPFDHIVIDEAQDLGPSELRFFAAIAPDHADALFLAGDLARLPLSLSCGRRTRIRSDWWRCAVGATALSSLCLPPPRPSASRLARVPFLFGRCAAIFFQ
jgi:hypothetical protein